MPTYRHGRHEFGQNFLTDNSVIDAIVGLVSRTDGPIVEIGPGSGALTLPLQTLGRPITAVELDRGQARSLGGRVDPHTTTVVHEDFLRYRLPRFPHTVVGNLPFHLTTAMLRRLMHAERWSTAVLVTQWEVARRRAGVGGATMMTAQWWPWYEFTLERRVPCAAFTPRPGVDAGLMVVRRLSEPLLAPAARHAYQGFVHAVFTGRGHGLRQILPRLAPPHRADAVRRWLAAQRFGSTPLPRDLSARQWAELFTVVRRPPPDHG
ncbi:23S ribosomal RNA methyltransferase Erm [Streptomyces sp. NPDC002514]|uniref:23S ribosomal RNA methyltransferase Erm n=1 Tax=Streptomyces sp. NPDC001270 TaxID=3364554 RepID=UPI0036C9176A